MAREREEELPLSVRCIATLSWKWETPIPGNCEGNQASKNLPTSVLTKKHVFNHDLKTCIDYPNVTLVQFYFKVQKKENFDLSYLPHGMTDLSPLRINSKIASIHNFFLFHFYTVVYKQKGHFSWPRQSCTWSLQGNKG